MTCRVKAATVIGYGPAAYATVNVTCASKLEAYLIIFNLDFTVTKNALKQPFTATP